MSPPSRFSYFLGILCLSTLPHTHSYLEAIWSDTQYGPDGPWQAVKVSVGGNDSTNIRLSQLQTTVDLLPSTSGWSSNILAPETCGSSSCPPLSTWDPLDAPTDIKINISWNDPAQGLSAPSNRAYNTQGMTINQKFAPNVSMASIADVTITTFNGAKRQPLLGTLTLGQDGSQKQTFTSSEEVKRPDVEAWLYSAYLFNRSFIESYSFGLHIGSAALSYPGSLLFGGYDNSRIIGPYTTYDEFVQLQDIGIGVETGTSPFEFDSKDGLLLSNNSQQVSLQVVPDSGSPYLSLPSQTCEAISRLLPVYFDQSLQYYLWNTTHPNFTKIVNSPAYLSFTFPLTSGKSGNVPIKVPFRLLNLTLEQPITQSGNRVQYFPCAPFNPLEGDYYRLGRAFLQAAFIGRNFNRKRSWLAQAPGPDIKGSTDFRDIQDGDMDLSAVSSDTGVFAQSWKGYWQPLNSDGTLATSDSGGGGLSTGAKVGIAVGVSVPVIALIVAGLRIFHVRRKRASLNPNEQLLTTYHLSEMHDPSFPTPVHELEGISGTSK